ncbi:MAG: CBS domain-containing protein [Alphaproteobacteria bacterium]|nr:CBS domain-containing protein [Alphaproteobacteria bacterium]
MNSRSRQPSMLIARDLMQTSVRTVRPDDRVYDTVKMLVRKGLSGAPVVDADRRVVGMLSEKDCIKALVHAVVERLPSHLVEHVMSRDVRTVLPETHYLTVAHLFLQHPIRRLPVVDGEGRLVGIIGRSDLLKHAIDVFEAAPSREAAILYLSAFEGTIPPS